MTRADRVQEGSSHVSVFWSFWTNTMERRNGTVILSSEIPERHEDSTSVSYILTET